MPCSDKGAVLVQRKGVGGVVVDLREQVPVTVRDIEVVNGVATVIIDARAVGAVETELIVALPVHSAWASAAKGQVVAAGPRVVALVED